MKIITKCQVSTAVYWAPLRVNNVLQTDDYGLPLFKSPVELTCRKDDEEKQVINATGTVVLSTSQYIVDQAVEVGGFIVEGELTKITKPTKPREVLGAKEILAIANTPTLRGNKILHEAFV